MSEGEFKDKNSPINLDMKIRNTIDGKSEIKN